MATIMSICSVVYHRAKSVSWLSLALMCVALFPAHAPAAQDALKRIADRGQINIGFNEDAPPFSVRAGRAGDPVGYSIDLCVAMAERIKQETGQPDLRVKFLPVPTDQMARIVRSAGVDLMCAGTSDTVERRASMAFSQPIFISSVKMMVRNKDGYKDAADVKGKPIAVLGRTTAEPAVLAFSKQKKLNLEISRAVSADAALSKLRLGHVAAWARDEVLLRGIHQRQPDAADFSILPNPMSSEVIAIAFPSDSGLQRVVDQTLAGLARDGRLETLYQKWFVQPNPAAQKGLNLPLSTELKEVFERQR